MTGQREDLGCDAVITRASANPTGSSGAGMALQNCPALGRGDWTFIPLHRPVTGCRLSLEVV